MYLSYQDVELHTVIINRFKGIHKGIIRIRVDTSKLMDFDRALINNQGTRSSKQYSDGAPRFSQDYLPL
ncbi:unnamed protein product [Rhizophagus irregularis]|nr:unnamed protein product [Rhizophagus irregularis]CAB5360026.1 unnamed protein product [Rhizophagus irregularis]